MNYDQTSKVSLDFLTQFESVKFHSAIFIVDFVFKIRTCFIQNVIPLGEKNFYLKIGMKIWFHNSPTLHHSLLATNDRERH